MHSSDKMDGLQSLLFTAPEHNIPHVLIWPWHHCVRVVKGTELGSRTYVEARLAKGMVVITMKVK